MSKKICVFDHADKNYFTCAKDALFGNGAFLRGHDYIELQELLNSEIRTDHHLVKWSDDAPNHIRRIDILSKKSYARCHQKWLKLTHMGEGRLQRVLTERYGPNMLDRDTD